LTPTAVLIVVTRYLGSGKQLAETLR
jgi:hypothetical protein